MLGFFNNLPPSRELIHPTFYWPLNQCLVRMRKKIFHTELVRDNFRMFCYLISCFLQNVDILRGQKIIVHWRSAVGQLPRDDILRKFGRNVVFWVYIYISFYFSSLKLLYMLNVDEFKEIMGILLVRVQNFEIFLANSANVEYFSKTPFSQRYAGTIFSTKLELRSWNSV